MYYKIRTINPSHYVFSRLTLSCCTDRTNRVRGTMEEGACLRVVTLCRDQAALHQTFGPGWLVHKDGMEQCILLKAEGPGNSHREIPKWHFHFAKKPTLRTYEIGPKMTRTEGNTT